jgi:hypothetical protein
MTIPANSQKNLENLLSKIKTPERSASQRTLGSSADEAFDSVLIKWDCVAVAVAVAVAVVGGVTA